MKKRLMALLLAVVLAAPFVAAPIVYGSDDDSFVVFVPFSWEIPEGDNPDPP